jgi:hypothetical protein
MSSPLCILCLENDPTDAQLLQESLESEGIARELTRVEITLCPRSMGCRH